MTILKQQSRFNYLTTNNKCVNNSEYCATVSAGAIRKRLSANAPPVGALNLVFLLVKAVKGRVLVVGERSEPTCIKTSDRKSVIC